LRRSPIAQNLQFVPAFGQPVAVDEYARPMQSDEIETAQTVAIMNELAAADAPHRLVVNAVECALAEAGITMGASALEKACAVYWWLKNHVEMIPTEGTNPLVDQTLIPPASLLAMDHPQGDCPQFSMLASAMLRVSCVASHFKTIAADEDFPDLFSHVYNVVETGPGQFLPFDSSHGPAPGAEYAQQFKARVWRTPQQYRCKEYGPGPRGNANMLRPASRHRIPTNRNTVLRRGLQGAGEFNHLYMTLNGGRMGDNGDYLDIYSAAGVDPTYVGTQDETVTYGGDSTTPLSALVNNGLAPSAAAGTAGTGGNGYSLAASLAADATALASPIVRAATAQAPYYTTNPATGQSQLFNPATGQFVTSSLTSSIIGALTTITSNPIYLSIGAGLLGLLLFSGGKGGR
jgi:hypothetical protein